jgi:methyl-accepting chemotaxis protein
MRALQNVSIRTKLLISSAVAVIAMLAVAGAMLFSYRAIIMEQKELATKHVVETAAGVLDHFAALAQQGKLDEAQAKKSALAELQRMRYEGSEYFWVNDMHPTMIMHPVKPELDGKDLSEIKDPTGKRLFVEFVNTVRQHKAGFVHYLWPKPGFNKPVPKISYVQGFEPWGWIIGSGIYIDDVDAAFWAKLSASALMVVLAALVLVAVSVYFTRSIGTSLRRAVETASAVAEGDLTRRAESAGTDEVGQVLAAMDRMNAGLHRVVTKVREGSDAVSAAANQIAAGHSDLARRTQQEGAALEETAASLEQMTSTVKQTAENAHAANELANGTRQKAETGGQVVTRAVEAMSEINVASRHIADIITVIDEIAFQTNLLALNAAVEAARAGEQGRGFAVVASEVRNLAQRSAKAAKEIKDLIRDSVEKVKHGTDLVDESGRTLDDIVAAVNKLTGIVAEIAAASQEQAIGIEQVNKAMTQMDGTTQQNAALVEEAAAASHSMEEQAHQLVDVVRFFKLGGEAAGGASKRVT